MEGEEWISPGEEEEEKAREGMSDQEVEKAGEGVGRDETENGRRGVGKGCVTGMRRTGK